jgi:hypothetical protein
VSKNITLSVSDVIFEKMKGFPEIKWSEVARTAIQERIEMLDALERIGSKSRLTDKDVLELGKKIKKGMAKRHGLVK